MKPDPACSKERTEKANENKHTKIKNCSDMHDCNTTTDRKMKAT